ncbi:DUF3105 domain-containing protein [Nocardioides sp. CER19]|uniref:DUF3105 domain-containing protein n=1 Tax=Nocardioides sp. CER19 TaxID=3038538 RepID=UPI00244BD6D8|nr:DUF3105 domain-containing protein [Nocardioides sp. CER19]MDH2415114.1 DUF3105 domain-containing protein [Nocardioides sp. CER19]
MAKKTAAQNNRRAVIDDIRKKQKGAERRRGYAIVGVCAVVAVLIVGAAAFRPVKDWWDERQFNDVQLADIGASASTCDKITTQKADGNQQHVPTGTPVDYTTAPPAFGAHWNEAGVAPVAMEKKFYAWTERPELEALVHNLEHGYTIVWYDETASKDSEEMSQLRAIAAKFPGTSNWRYKFKIVPWLPTDENGKKFPSGKHIAISHWSAGGTGQTDTSKQVGAFQYCGSVSGAAIKDFMTKYPYTDSPEPTAM